jgi:hypothetical protein
MFAKTKTVKVALRNDSGSPLQLKVGDEIVSLDAGKSVALKLAVGTRIVVNAATDKHQAGELIAEASTALDNNPDHQVSRETFIAGKKSCISQPSAKVAAAGVPSRLVILKG